MSKDNKPHNHGSADSEWWTEARRKAASDYRKAHPSGSRSPEWWAAHPEKLAAARDRLVGARAILAANRKARREAGG